MNRYVGPQGLGYLRRVALAGLSAGALLLVGCSGFRLIAKIENGGQSFDDLGPVVGTVVDIAQPGVYTAAQPGQCHPSAALRR